MNNEKQSSPSLLSRLDNFKIDGYGLVFYALIGIIFVLAVVTKALSTDILGALFTMLVVGNICYYLGGKLPIFRSYLGGGSFFALMVPATLVFFHIIPADVVLNVKTFLTTDNFLNFYIVALITSAILGMNRDMLLKATVRFLPVAIISGVVAFFTVGLVSMLIGKGFSYGALYVAFPAMGGGVGTGAVPLSKIYAAGFHGNAGTYFSHLLPAVILANIFAILGASWVSKIFKNSKYNGHGEMIPGKFEEVKTTKAEFSFTKVGVGMGVAGAIYMVGEILHKLVPSVSDFAFIIILVILVKAFGLIPKYYEESTVMFGQSVTKTTTHALLGGMGIAMVDLSVLTSSITWQFVLLVLVGIIAISLTAFFVGKLFGLYPVEAAITAGFINNSMGGTGNVSVLAACDRMGLMAFAQMGNRLCGALVLVASGLYIAFFG
ncbi:2-hydroxycarboxylate transporter family protein [Fructilactobacillus sp. Tb1]|uniref:2-hydroxycarboxylate transporter family protein n=1 Tax=Fructilactobacillus sp. Tb1 TaxID=3422304 RepID=UPI003D29DAC9